MVLLAVPLIEVSIERKCLSRGCPLTVLNVSVFVYMEAELLVRLSYSVKPAFTFESV